TGRRARVRGDQRIPAVELTLVEAYTEAQAGFERRVEWGEVGTEVAVSALHPQRVEDSVATGSDAERPTRFHEPVPHLHRPFRVHVELPSELAHVRDPLGEDGRASHADVACRHGRAGLGGPVVVG